MGYGDETILILLRVEISNAQYKVKLIHDNNTAVFHYVTYSVSISMCNYINL